MVANHAPGDPAMTDMGRGRRSNKGGRGKRTAVTGPPVVAGMHTVATAGMCFGCLYKAVGKQGKEQEDDKT
jgi:hypothetical protein